MARTFSSGAGERRVSIGFTATAALFLAIVLLGENPATAQGVGGPPDILDLVIGQSIAAQPTDFQEFACGTNGGPPSLPLAGFADFARCPAEANGLREVQFRTDDELYYRALAALDPMAADLLQGNKLGDFPIIASALFDDGGVLRAVRAVTDDRISDTARRSSYGLAEFVQRIYGSAGWACTDLPPEDGETALGNRLVKQDCREVTAAGLVITTQARLLRRQGQSLINPADGQLRPGQFISTARMEMFAADASGNPDYGDVGNTAAHFVIHEVVPAPPDPVAAFLGGATSNCPGCDLAGADLKRRDLAGADLAGANLTGAILHRTLLGGANLAGANLTGADLNLADLKRANLTGANLAGALLYMADASGADLSDAVFDRTVAEQARFTSAHLAGISLQGADALSANLAGADLTGANLSNAYLNEADLQRANLSGADLSDASLVSARLRSANLTGATAPRADFLQADLSGAALVNADLSGANLLRARTTGADLTGAILAGATMPDVSTHP